MFTNYFNQIYSRILQIDAVQRQTMVTLFSRIVLTLFGYVGTMYFARTVGASVLGSYFLFMAYYGVCTMVLDGGFGTAATKRISEGNEPDAYFSAYVVQYTLSALLTIVILIISRDFFVDFSNSGLFMLLPFALLISISSTIANGVYGRGKVGVYAASTVINDVLRILAQIGAVFLGFGAAGLVGGFIFGMLARNIILSRFLDLHIVRFKWKHVKSLSSYSFWVYLSTGGNMIFSYADTILIGYFLVNSDVGVYRITYQLAVLGTFTTTALLTTFWPKISRWGANGEYGHIERSLSNVFTYSLLLAVPVFVGGSILGDKLLYFLYGAGFVRGTNVLIILLALQIVNVFQLSFTGYLNAMGHPKESFKVIFIASSANIVFNIVLIPILGIVGAAIATLATMTLNALLARRALSRLITIQLERRSLLNIMMASAVMGMLVGGYRLLVPLTNVWVILLAVGVGGVVYSVLILKLDRKISGELRGIMEGMGIKWPKWL